MRIAYAYRAFPARCSMQETSSQAIPESLPQLARQQSDRRGRGAPGRLLLVIAGPEPHWPEGMPEDLAVRTEMLSQVADRLRRAVRDRDLVVQRADGNFLIALVDCLPEQAAIRLSRLLRGVGQAPLELGGHSIEVVLAAGAATFSEAAGDDAASQRAAIDHALARASAALVASRDRGSDRALLVFDGLETVAGHPLAAGSFTEISRDAKIVPDGAPASSQ